MAIGEKVETVPNRRFSVVSGGDTSFGYRVFTITFGTVPDNIVERNILLLMCGCGVTISRAGEIASAFQYVGRTRVDPRRGEHDSVIISGK